MISHLILYVCLSWDNQGCASEEVWREHTWEGPAAAVQCTIERDLARARNRESSTPQMRRWECESGAVGE